MTMSGHRTGAVFKRYKVRTTTSQRAAQENVAVYRESERARLAEEAKKVVGLVAADLAASCQNPTTPLVTSRGLPRSGTARRQRKTQ
jgi:hypothetical protein